ncbi:glucosaminidase domain-containing protein [Paraflavisolibacter sp. H34]|uniref:glucosaminidase domain-containing protein n=1 Tax=Huijunlia imazamoxiresistens TaxID=3127457 RepID=UPI003018D0FF
MKLLHTALALFLFFAGKIALAQSPALKQNIGPYIERYKDLAIAEMKRTGVPAAITLAQGILETEAGTSWLVTNSNNHFGIKCKSTWKGEWVSHDDDARGECFRKYPSPEDSYRDHSDFLRSGARYAFLFNYDPADYESWCHGLKKAGYATNPKYPQILIKYIREYNLQDYTLIALGRQPESREVLAKVALAQDAPAPPPAVATTTPAAAAAVPVIEPMRPVYPEGVFQVNETDVVFVPKGTSYLSIAQQYRVRLSRLFDFNDMADEEFAAEDRLVYLQRKRKTGAHEFHTVATGEDLYQIAQMEGIRLETLQSYNHLKNGMKPQVGEVLSLHRKAESMPRLVPAGALVAQAPRTAEVVPADAMAMAAPVINKPREVVAGPNAGTDNTALSGATGGYLVHVVQAKETVYSISRKYAVRVDDVLRWNGLHGSATLKAGQQLRIKRM